MKQHYIRLDEDKNIIKAFSTAFEKFESGDILILDNAPRHFDMSMFPKGLMDNNGKYNYEHINSKITERSEAEKWTQAELDEIEKQNIISQKKVEVLETLALQKAIEDGVLNPDGSLKKS